MAFTRDAILGKIQPKVKNIGPIPGWEDLGDAYIRHINVRERNEWAAIRLRALESEGAGAFGDYLEARVHLVAFALCDADGNRVFEDIDDVYGLDPQQVDHIAVEAEKVNGLDADSEKEIQGN